MTALYTKLVSGQKIRIERNIYNLLEYERVELKVFGKIMSVAFVGSVWRVDE